MSDNIDLHPTRALDPRFAICPYCHKRHNELVIGHLFMATLDDGTAIFAQRSERQKAARRVGQNLKWKEVPEDMKEIPTHPCEACYEAAVAFRCAECGVSGLILGESAKAIREQTNTAPTEKIGIQIDKCADFPHVRHVSQ